MVSGLSITVVLFLAVLSASAQVSVHISNGYPVYRSYPVYQAYPANLPPGQAKKIYGMKSARYFAHEHQGDKYYKHWKHARDYGDDDDQGDGYYENSYRYYKHGHWGRHDDDDDQGYRYYPVAYPPVYSQPGVTINAHVHLPLGGR